MNVLTNKKRLLACYKELIDNISQVLSDEEIELLKNRQKDFEEEQFKIVVAGRFSSGKSRLINSAFLQDDILPSKNKPTTCHPVYIQYGEEKKLVLRDMEGNTKEIAGNDTGAIKQALTDFGTLYGDNPKQYQMIELNWPDMELLKSGVVFIDTIGTEDTEEHYIKQTYREMDRASAVIFLTSVKQAGTNTEKDLIEKYLSNTGKKLFIVLTQSDRLDPSEQEVVRANFCQRFKPFFAEKDIQVEDRVFLTSAVNGDGVDELRSQLIEFIANNSFEKIFQQHCQQLDLVLQDKLRKKEHCISTYNVKKEGGEVKLRKAIEDIEYIEKSLLDDEIKMDQLKYDLKEEAGFDLKCEIEKFRNIIISDLRVADSAGLKLIGQEIIDALEGVSEKVGKKTQLNIRQSTEKRIRSFVGDSENDRVNERINFIGSSESIEWTKNLGNLGEMSGFGAIFMSVYLGVNAGVTAANAGAAASAQTGLFGSIVTFFYGAPAGTTLSTATMAGTGTTISAGLQVAFPWLFGGLAVMWLGKTASSYLVDSLKKKNKAEAIEMVRNVLIEFAREFYKTIECYIDTEVDKIISMASINFIKDKEHLQSVINENDLEKIQNQIDNEKSKLKWIEQSISQVESCRLT